MKRQVDRYRPEMNSKATMLPRALQTDPYSIGHTHPLRVECTTFKTNLWRAKGKLLDCIAEKTAFNSQTGSADFNKTGRNIKYLALLLINSTHIVPIVCSHFLQHSSAPWTSHFA